MWQAMLFVFEYPVTSLIIWSVLWMTVAGVFVWRSK